jgi:predicted enzyme related to lactoylglutathione lyase
MPDEGPAERITGIGGVFFRARDPQALGEWYRDHLGVPVDEQGHAIIPESRNTVWSPFKADTDYWPAEKQHMTNFTVRDLDAMLAQLRAAGVEVDERVEDLAFGRFGWATDPEGNRIELWQPIEPPS